MKVTFRQACRHDVTRQFRYYLVSLDLPETAVRFKNAVKKTATAISKQPYAAPRYYLRNPHLQDLRSWPGAGFEEIRLYFFVETETMRVVRILHGKRNVCGILEQQKTTGH